MKLVTVLALMLAALGLTAAAAHEGGRSDAASLHARGLVYRDLVKGGRGPCGGMYRLDMPGRARVCSHGPDAAPGGVDVRRHRSTTELRQAAREESGLSATAGVPCVGDGVSGPRVQAIYAVASDKTDRYGSIAALIPGWAAGMDAALNQSAAETGGERHIRFLTNGCSLVISHVVLSATGDDSFTNTVNELKAQGFNTAGRKYMIWVDANVYCGIGSIMGDDSAGSSNVNNSAVSYGRSDQGCWGGTSHFTELHELMHNLGAVQLSAPHTSGGWHCTDESDLMCYADAAGVVMNYVCPSSHEGLLDCNHDDYFNTSPPANSYLATKWNSANSVFLVSGPVTPAAALSLARTANPNTYDATSQALSFGYTITNSGSLSIGPAQFTIADSKISGGAAFNCGGASTTLAPAATLTCSATYTTVQGDLDAGSIVSTATGSGGGVTSPAATLTVSAANRPTTTTSTFTGSISSKRPKKAFPVSIGAGATASSLQFTVSGRTKPSSATLTLRVLRTDGTVVASATGGSVLALPTAALAAGNYTWEVSGSVSASFTLTVTYTTP